MQGKSLTFICLSGLLAAGAVQAAVTVEMHAISADGIGESIGTVTLENQMDGVLLTPDLKNLAPAGIHGFHAHQNPSCEAAEKDGQMTAGLAAGGHFDPHSAGNHHGPYADSGHLGDLPPLYVKEDGTVTTPVFAPRLTLEDLQGRSLMIHKGGDNFSDQPDALGGGGARIACGVIAP